MLGTGQHPLLCELVGCRVTWSAWLQPSAAHAEEEGSQRSLEVVGGPTLLLWLLMRRLPCGQVAGHPGPPALVALVWSLGSGVVLYALILHTALVTSSLAGTVEDWMARVCSEVLQWASRQQTAWLQLWASKSSPSDLDMISSSERNCAPASPAGMAPRALRCHCCLAC